MSEKKPRDPGLRADAANSGHTIPEAANTDATLYMKQTLTAILHDCDHAAALMPWGAPCPIKLPDPDSERRALIHAHIAGAGATVTTAIAGKVESLQSVAALQLFALMPDRAGRCSWLGIDLDSATGHGPGGLADCDAAARCLASIIADAGLFDGLLVVRSRGGAGIHVWLMPAEPCTLADAAIAVGAVMGRAMRQADHDAREYAGPHAFRRADATIALPGDAGAIELLPRGDTRPARGWSLALPFGGAAARHGGGIHVDAWTGRPAALTREPRCDPDAWALLLSEARRRVRHAARPAMRPARAAHGDGLARLSARTREFLRGGAPVGQRNAAAFGSACDLLARGISNVDAERLVLAGAAACGLPGREALSALASAAKAVRA